MKIEGKSRMPKMSVSLRGHKTSLSIEPEFWAELRAAAAADNKGIGQYVEGVIDAWNETVYERGSKFGGTNVSSALRVHLLLRLKRQVEEQSSIQQRVDAALEGV